MKKIYIYLLVISLITTEAFCGGIGLPDIIQKKVKKLDEKIKLTSPSITVISPNGGEVWQPGSQQTIRYSWTGSIPYVCIRYWNDVDNDNIDDGGEVFLITSAPYPASNGEYKWTVPNISSNRVKVMITGYKTSLPTDEKDVITLDMSDNFFTIGTTGRTTYYLAYDKTSQEEVLRKTPGPSSDGWTYVTLYLYPESSVEWKTTLTQNIIGDEYGFNITIRSGTDTRIKLEWILKKKVGSETILKTQYIDNKETSGNLFNGHRGTVGGGINPNSGNQDTLIFRITHISGSRVEIVCDGKVSGEDHPYISVIH